MSNMWILYSLVVLLTSSVTLGKYLPTGQHAPERIVGGIEIDIAEAPWTASVHGRLTGSNYMFSGGGVIISQKFVATIAMVFMMSVSTDFYVRVGSTYASSGGQLIEAEEFICREDARRNNSNIGLLRLMENIQFGQLAYPIALPFPGQEVPYGKNSIITGWGYIDNAATKATKLRRLSTDIWNDQTNCKAMVPENAFSENIFCAGGVEGSNTCTYDEGAPLVVDDVLVGITTVAYGCFNYSSAYLKVSSQVDWIVSVIEKSFFRNPGVVSNNLADLYTVERPYSGPRIIQSCYRNNLSYVGF